MEEQWINKMRQKMEGHEEPAPQGLWEDIEKSIHQQRPQPLPMYKRVTLWTAGIGAAAAAIMAIVFFIGNNQSRQLSPSLAQQPQLAMQQNETVQTSTKLENNIPPEAQSYLAVNSSNTTGKYAPSPSPERSSAVISEVNTVLQEVSKVEDSPRKETAHKELNRKATRSVQHASRQRPLLSSREDPEKREQASHISASLYAANLPHSSEQLNDYSEFVTGNTLPQDFTTEQSVGKTPVKDIIYSNLGKKVQTHKKHRLPVRFGVSFRYQFNDRWSLESGLTYTYLSADLTSGSASHHYDSEQRLHYLGIPLNVNFDCWKNRHWNFYASAGGSIDKCIHGHLDTDFILNNRLTSSESKSIMEKPVQFSVNGALGAQWNITEKFGLYAEPGVVYYFDNGSRVETIYKDRPFNFNFKLGVRLTFN